MNVKQLPIYIIILMGLVSCAGGSSSLRGRCEEGLCVKIEAVEPIIFGEPVTVIITVSSEKDNPALGISLYHSVKVVVEEAKAWEKGIKDVAIWNSGTSWRASVEANQPSTYMRTLHLPLQEGYYKLVVSQDDSDGYN